MARKAKRGTETKADILNIRVHPKIKYGLDLLSRKQHRTMTSVVEWAINRMLKDNIEGLSGKLDELWDTSEPDRYIKLALYYPELMTYEEELLWKNITNQEFYNYGKDSELLYERIRQNWPTLKTLIDGRKDHFEVELISSESEKAKNIAAQKLTEIFISNEIDLTKLKYKDKDLDHKIQDSIKYWNSLVNEKFNETQNSTNSNYFDEIYITDEKSTKSKSVKAPKSK